MPVPAVDVARALMPPINVQEVVMAIFRVYAGADGQSHFEDVEPKLQSQGDQSASAELIPGSGIVIRRFEAGRVNRITSYNVCYTKLLRSVQSVYSEGHT